MIVRVGRVVGTVAAWVAAVATALVARTCREAAAVNVTAAPLEVVGLGAAARPGPVAHEVLPVWEAVAAVAAVGDLVVAAAVVEAAAAVAAVEAAAVAVVGGSAVIRKRNV